MRKVASVGVAVLLAMTFSGARPSAQNMDAMLKWGAAKLIHWHLSGDYSAPVTILPARERAIKVNVSDHLEIDFDWDNTAIVGQPVIKNSPSKYAPPEKISGCPEVKVNGTLEFFTLDALNPMAVMLMLRGKQNRPAGSVPKADVNEVKPCGFEWETVAAATVPVTMNLQLPQAMMLAMGSTPGFEMEITKDGKSFIQKLNTDGWVWTMTPTIVK